MLEKKMIEYESRRNAILATQKRFCYGSGMQRSEQCFSLCSKDQRPLWDHVATQLNINCDTNYVSYSIINIFSVIISKKYDINYPGFSLYTVIQFRY